MLSEQLAVARGDRPADLVLKNLQLVNVYSGEVYPSEIAIYDGKIVGLGAGYTGAKALDLGGRYVAPGLIDAHVHVESSLCMPADFAKGIVPRGITTVITDPHEIANVMGLDGIRLMLEAGEDALFNMYVMASSCVPATHMETAGADLDAVDLASLLDNPWVIGLAEVMNYPGVVFGNENVLAKIERFKDLVLDGHCPALTGQHLNAYRAAGIQSDHECTTVEEAREKLRAGMVIFIRQGTMAHNLRDLLPLVTPENSRRICFCTDDRHPGDLLDEGSIDMMIRVAIQEAGIDPVTAIRMGTLNTAEHFRLRHLGAISPGFSADLMVFSDLYNLHAEMVFKDGVLVAEDGHLRHDPPVSLPTNIPATMQVAPASLDFRVPAAGTQIRVIGAREDQLITEHIVTEPTVADGEAVADVGRDILKMVVIERHRATGNVGKGFIHGIGLQRGAIAGTVAHDHHNLVVIGVDDASMQTAAQAVIDMGGGLAAVDGQQVLARLPLPIAGLMSNRPLAEVRQQVDALIAASHQLGSPMHDPFMVMGFMALEVIPKLKLTDIGLVDVEQFVPVPLFLP